MTASDPIKAHSVAMITRILTLDVIICLVSLFKSPNPKNAPPLKNTPPRLFQPASPCVHTPSPTIV